MRIPTWAFILLLTGLIGLAPLHATAKMIAVAVSILLILKTQVLHTFLARGGAATRCNRVAWFIAWPGLDAKAFFTARTTSHPTTLDWTIAATEMLVGGLLLLVIAPSLAETHDHVAGWIAMIGVVLVIHFGGFRMLALMWRRAGRGVSPIMHAPIATRSLSEFWSRRWNTAIRDFAHEFVFKPVAKRWNSRVATWASFAFSGFVHELAISIPAGSGFGLPFAYFLLQGLGVSLERRAARCGLPVRDGICGWLFAALFIVPAAYWLFHPPFVQRVILPIISN